MGNTLAKRVFTAVILTFGLAACVSPKYVVSDITRHHSLPRAPSGESFVIVSTDDEQEESLAFDAYAGLITQRLSGLGLKSFDGESATPDLVVTLKWSVEGPSPDVKSRSTGIGYGFGYGHRYGHFGYGYGDPFENRTSTKQMYVRKVDLVIYDGMTYNTENPTRVFEGSAVSTGTNGQIEPVMPYIVQAIFDQFPGASGETRTVRIEVPPDSEAVNTGQYNSRSAK
ncbi:MAG: DUF4136 domain-containing protein [Rhodospirillaceae bacterium]|jgi:hypothetical protein|nr:DUF4136 domain-containing protein [Rhodospirillaceae bacterium]MBT5242315.1 DUF4136 domain-containing protein [Rhodospirillaceae bacterium]MBT5566043.1 DUF4136 domain-containing protein [Rhodospirillaceae bacterium]MBT6089003.1 DUF4136 domain-containing protein [Rhodospirillaceae bacterium]MBT6962254.1 DUF4136 domain-containing protein [Rhodospirillaceae bacterium]